MPGRLPQQFNKQKYLHSSSRFEIIKSWFDGAAFSVVPSIRDYITNSEPFKAARRAIVGMDYSNFNIELNSPEIPFLYFFESQKYLNKAVSNFCSQLILHKKGCLSWAIITTYYSSLYALCGLLRLQGKARISTKDIPGLPRGFYASLSGVSSPNCIVFENWQNFHWQTFDDYRLSYRNFDLFTNSFQDLYSLNIDDLKNEVARRNSYNYGLHTGFREIDTYDYSRQDLENINAKTLRVLPSMITSDDPELSYLSKACSRIILLSSISWNICKISNLLRPIYDQYFSARTNFIKKVISDNSSMANQMICFARGRMRLR